MRKLMIEQDAAGNITRVIGLQEADVLIVRNTEDHDGSISVTRTDVKKLGKADFRDSVWDALAAGIDESSAKEHNIQLTPTTLKYIYELH